MSVRMTISCDVANDVIFYWCLKKTVFCVGNVPTVFCVFLKHLK